MSLDLRAISPFGADVSSISSPIVLFPFVGITISEILVVSGRLELALWGHLLTFGFCTLTPIWRHNDIAILQAFVLVPLFRLVNLGTPAFFELTLYWYPLVYGPLLPTIYLLARYGRVASIDMGWKTAGAFAPILLLVGLLVGEIEFMMLQPEALVPTQEPTMLLSLGVVMILFVATVEELLFRGILQGTLHEQIGAVPGVVLASVVFGLMHSGFGTSLAMLFGFSVGLLLGTLYLVSNSMLVNIIIHGVSNVFVFGLIPLRGPVIGITI